MSNKKINKPTIYTRNIVNLIEVCEYIEFKYNLKEDEVWDIITKYLLYNNFSNDTYVNLYLEDKMYYDKITDGEWEILSKINDEFPFNELLFEISW